MYLHSDEKLKILIMTTCSQYMAIPLTTLNPWEIDKES